MIDKVITSMSTKFELDLISLFLKCAETTGLIWPRNVENAEERDQQLVRPGESHIGPVRLS